MAFTFRPATREASKLLIGLSGPSGSGKTLTALRLAFGLGGSITVIDTEQGRALQYAPAPGERANPPHSFDFMHGILEPPFTSDRYQEAVEAAIQAKSNVLILDSMSHEWEGPGGILDQVDQAKKGGSNDFGVWAGPKQRHNRLVQTLLQVPSHVILCMRAKEKKGLVRNDRGKNEVVDLGWHPICEGGLTYELTINLLLGSEKKKGAPVVEGYDFGKMPINMIGLVTEGQVITEETGRKLAAWATGSAKISPPQEDPYIAASAAASGGKESFTTWWNGSGKPLRHLVKDRLAELQAIAAKAEDSPPAEEITPETNGTAASEPADPPKGISPEDEWSLVPAADWPGYVTRGYDMIDACKSRAEIDVLLSAPKFALYHAAKTHAPKAFASLDDEIAKKRKELGQ